MHNEKFKRKLNHFTLIAKLLFPGFRKSLKRLCYQHQDKFIDSILCDLCTYEELKEIVKKKKKERKKKVKLCH